MWVLADPGVVGLWEAGGDASEGADVLGARDVWDKLACPWGVTGVPVTPGLDSEIGEVTDWSGTVDGVVEAASSPGCAGC